MTRLKQTAVVIVGGNSSINYLIERYTERIGYLFTAMPASASADELCRLQPVAVIFPSVENLEVSQPLVAVLTNCDIPIIVCSSEVDQIRTRELGADYCLLHPLGYDHFSATLEAVRVQKFRQSEE